MHVLKQNKGIHIMKQGNRFPHKAISLAQTVWALYLLVRMCSRHKAHSYLTKQGLKDCAHETAFLKNPPQIY